MQRILTSTLSKYSPKAAMSSIITTSSNRRKMSSFSMGYPVAIIGTGPSAFYTAKYLLDQHPEVKVDLYERLPFPYGLVRYGVAPDHPEVKSVTHTFEEVMGKHAEDQRVRYYGHVEVSDTIPSTAMQEDVFAQHRVSLEAIRKHYSAVVLAYGADNDRALNLPGSDLPGVVSAHQFVNWYNGHPEYRHLHNTAFDLTKIKHVSIIGQGNVALDCARILTKDLHELATTDIADYALEALRHSSVETVSVIGRRGHVQAAFTIKELRELTRLPHVGVHIDAEELAMSSNEGSLKELENNRPKKRIIELIQQIANTPIADDCKRHIDIRFLLTPTSIEAKMTESGEKRVGQLTLARNELTGEPFQQQAKAKTDVAPIVLPCDLILTSIGYQSSSISTQIPFDTQRHVVHHQQGRVTYDPQNSKIHYEGDKVPNSTDEQVISGVYVTGWLKRGPTGIIGTNIADAKETTASIIDDISNKRLTPKMVDPVHAITEQCPQYTTTYQHAIPWTQVIKMDQHEIQQGANATPNKTRVKLTSVEDMLTVAATST